MKQNRKSINWKAMAIASACAFMATSASASLSLTFYTGSDDYVIATLTGSFITTNATSAATIQGSLGIGGDSETIGAPKNDGEAVNTFNLSNCDIGISGDWLTADTSLSSVAYGTYLNTDHAVLSISTSYTSETEVTFFTLYFDKTEWENAGITITSGSAEFSEQSLSIAMSDAIPEPASLSLIALLSVGMLAVRRFLRM